tara:strand:- start:10212 stop:11006 length:795 start_codon:yes stop_codon:yes gene_type:complete
VVTKQLIPAHTLTAKFRKDMPQLYQIVATSPRTAQQQEPPMKPRSSGIFGRLSHPGFLMSQDLKGWKNWTRWTTHLTILSGLAALSGCSGMSILEAPYYQVTDVQSFKTYGAPSQAMRIEIHDRASTLPDAVWAQALSNHGYPPRITFLTADDTPSSDQTLRDGYRVVAVVNPTLATSRQKMCTSPETAETIETAGTTEKDARVTVRFAFCAGKDIISEVRAHIVKNNFEQELVNNADSVNFMLFPRQIRDRGDRNCNRFAPGC